MRALVVSTVASAAVCCDHCNVNACVDCDSDNEATAQLSEPRKHARVRSAKKKRGAVLWTQVRRSTA